MAWVLVGTILRWTFQREVAAWNPHAFVIFNLQNAHQVPRVKMPLLEGDGEMQPFWDSVLFFWPTLNSSFPELNEDLSGDPGEAKSPAPWRGRTEHGSSSPSARTLWKLTLVACREGEGSNHSTCNYKDYKLLVWFLEISRFQSVPGSHWCALT